jgi:hypothetical protein
LQKVSGFHRFISVGVKRQQKRGVEHKGLGFTGLSSPALLLRHQVFSPGCIFTPVNPVWDSHIFLFFRCQKTPSPIPYILRGVQRTLSQVVGDSERKDFRLYPRKSRGRQGGTPRTWCSTVHPSRSLCSTAACSALQAKGSALGAVSSVQSAVRGEGDVRKECHSRAMEGTRSLHRPRES